MPVLLHPVIGGLPKACRQARDPNLVHTVTWTPSMCNTDLPIVIPLELSGWVLAGSPALTGLIRSFTITVLLLSQRKFVEHLPHGVSCRSHLSSRPTHGRGLSPFISIAALRWLYFDC